MNGVTLTVVAVLIVVIVVLAVIGLLVNRSRVRSGRLQERFGPEYDRAVETAGGRKQAEDELRARQKRVQSFNIRALTTDERQMFANRWRAAQAQFVDAPAQAIVAADALVKEVMQARGYPVGDFEQNAADLSVDHADVVSNYRAARDLVVKQQQGRTSTEDLRQAMVHFRALFEDLLRIPAGQDLKETVP